MQKYRSIVRSCPKTAMHTQRRTPMYICRCVLIVSPTSSKIPLLLRFSLPVFHRYAMHLTISTRLAFYYALRKIKRGFPFILSSSLLSLVLYSRVLYVCLSHYFFILLLFLYYVTAVFVKVDRDGERRERKDSLLRLSPDL